jgi:hypothetical protein
MHRAKAGLQNCRLGGAIEGPCLRSGIFDKPIAPAKARQFHAGLARDADGNLIWFFLLFLHLFFLPCYGENEDFNTETGQRSAGPANWHWLSHGRSRRPLSNPEDAGQGKPIIVSGVGR